MSMRSAALLALLGSLCGCAWFESEYDAGGKQQREKEAAKERRKEQEQVTHERCMTLLGERERLLDAAVAEIGAASVAGEEDLQRALDRWKELRKQVTGDLPPECDQPVPTRIDPDEQAFLEERRPRRAARKRALLDRAQREHDALRRGLLGRSIPGDAPVGSRRLLIDLRDWKYGDQPDPELSEWTRKIAAAYDARLLATFREHGGYGRLGRDRFGSAFSREPWPEALGDAVEPRFTSHFEGEGTVHALARLPRAARSYGGRTAADLSVQLVSGSGFNQLVLASRSLGTPEFLGDAELLRGSFDIPPRKLEQRVRHFYEVRVLLSWQDAVGRTHSQELSRSGFTWLAK